MPALLHPRPGDGAVVKLIDLMEYLKPIAVVGFVFDVPTNAGHLTCHISM